MVVSGGKDILWVFFFEILRDKIFLNFLLYWYVWYKDFFLFEEEFVLNKVCIWVYFVYLVLIVRWGNRRYVLCNMINGFFICLWFICSMIKSFWIFVGGYYFIWWFFWVLWIVWSVFFVVVVMLMWLIGMVGMVGNF